MMNLKLIALCLGLHIAHSLGGPVNGASGTSLADAIEGSAEQVPASPEVIDTTEKDRCYYCHPQCKHHKCCGGKRCTYHHGRCGCDW
ncbi:hypothetical protein COCSADRAFT_38877 [Bipolaris sorokiniana ND90Pr]|uniref:Uncharacterized protein n=1 Tax=Cochliobolus sativus (strain ND90Pr / ATCC 201652) TaxID=665912 RepID=M2SZ62_COCSN|nr:uncharacterized protein COCSADRAFT_38877 [Bipolaris sorokiniana ND90Pr]EMD62077.1 hypothetical protein COCSADRAFT_38877 [Bipolaris sorokiniana ND90Pr]